MFKKIFVIGNAAAGKTRLCRRLAQLHDLPLIHVDTLQFLPGLMLRPHQETSKILQEIASKDSWIIDGFGPLDSFESRLQMADRIIFLDWPLWKNYWWLARRQVEIIFHPRAELPAGSKELCWSQLKKSVDYIYKVHRQMRPELLRILDREIYRGKVTMIRDNNAWRKIEQSGV